MRLGKSRQAVVWIASVGERLRGDQLGAANAAASRLELTIVGLYEGRERRRDAIDAAGHVGTLLVPSIEHVAPDPSDALGLLGDARRAGWRVLALDFGSDTAAPSGDWLIGQFRALAAAACDGPVPPAHIRRRVAVGGEATFRASGLVHTREYLAALDVMPDGLRVLDWGAGAGRMTRHLLDAMPSARITAVDIDGEAIDWLRANLPVHRALTVGIDPPMPVGEDAFDLVVGHSVLTHLDETAQDAWLAELARVARPGATLLLSVHGPHAARWHVEHTLCALPGAVAAALPALGFFFWRGEGWEAEFHDGYHTTFHDPGYVREHWSQWFDVLDVRSAAVGGLQDIVVLRGR
jgi:SAM-dependent methyltransferase